MLSTGYVAGGMALLLTTMLHGGAIFWFSAIGLWSLLRAVGL